MDLGVSEFTHLKYPTIDFIQNPLFLLASSLFIHLILFFGLIISWVCNYFERVRSRQFGHPKDRNFWYYKPVFFPSLGLSLYNLALFCLNCFYWYRIGWSPEKLLTLLDLALKVFAWLLVSIHLHRLFHHCLNGVKLPFLLRIWWGFYVAVSSYSFVIHIIHFRGDRSFQIPVLVSDAVYVISGIFLCCVLIFGKVNSEETNLQEPLLNGNGRVDSNKTKENETVSPYLNANFLSSLTFTWVGSLISKGYKKTLDLEDVPSLWRKDNVSESHMIFRNCMDSAREGSGKKVTTMQLVKSLIFTTWVDILLTAFFCLIYTLASYVGPCLIDTFVQYLNGRREFKNEGYLLVSTFFIAKLVECLSQRHWFFRLQVTGIRAKSMLIESIYNKALTLSCRSKQGHTSGAMINFMSVDAERIGDFSWYMHDPWMVILQIALALLILYKSLGLASIAALVATVVIMLANYPLTTLLEKYQEKLMESKDQRMKATSEILKNMRILKLQAWEMKFCLRLLS